MSEEDEVDEILARIEELEAMADALRQSETLAPFLKPLTPETSH